MKKLFSKLTVLVMVLAAAIMLAGCDYEEKLVIDENGDVTVSLEEWVSEDEMRELMVSMGEDANEAAAITAQELEEAFADREDYIGKRIGADGKVLFGIKSDQEMDLEESPYYTISATEFVYTIPTSESEDTASEDISDEELAALNDMMKFTLFVTMPAEIKSTNGTLSADKKTVSFKIDLLDRNLEGKSFYAYTSAKPTSKITLDGVTADMFTKAKKIKVVCDEKIKSVTVNGEKQTSKTVYIKEDGTYSIEVVTADGKEAFTVIRDTAKPKVSGVKNNKTYSKTVTVKFSDAGSGIKSATLNGKKISTKKKVKANGDYTLVVTDNAGNEKTVKFTIKK